MYAAAQNRGRCCSQQRQTENEEIVKLVGCSGQCGNILHQYREGVVKLLVLGPSW